MVEPLKLVFQPGINRETTDYGNSGGWYDCNLVRFKNGQPESVGGWTRFTTQIAQGTYRSLFPFSMLSGQQLYGAGTSWKYYLVYGVSLVDITPIRATSTINNNPFATLNGSKLITVTDTAHGAVVNDFVTYSGTTGPFGGVPAADFNKEHQVVTVINANSYTINVATTASSSTSGGGANVVATYQISVGLDTTVYGAGWGTGPWNGAIGWGTSSEVSVPTNQLRLWSQDTFGEDLLYNVRNGGIYYKDTSAGLSGAGVNITTLGDGPSVGAQVLVSDNDRHTIVFGANPVGSSVQDPLLARWATSESVAIWTPNTTNTAGSLRFDTGAASTFMAAVETTNEILVFTDVSLHSMRFVGPPFTFGQTRVGSNIRLIGPNAVCTTGSETYWMAFGRFQMYNGVVQDLPLMVRSYIFSILNYQQTAKICCGVNRQFGEVWWHMPVNGSNENNFYVVWNYADGTAYYGSFNDAGRTVWIDSLYQSTPLACSPDGYIYQHDIGATDGAVTPTAGLDAYLEGSVMELGAGADFVSISRHIPDFSFDGSTAAAPEVQISFLKRDYPGSPFVTGPQSPVIASSVTEYTTKNDIRFRARSAAYRIDTIEAGTLWQLGVPRVYAAPAGQR